MVRGGEVVYNRRGFAPGPDHWPAGTLFPDWMLIALKDEISADLSVKESDPRRIRSRKLLHEALLQLLKKRAYKDLSVAEVASAAGVTRATFYAHASSVDDMIKNIVREWMAEFEEKLTDEVFENAERRQLQLGELVEGMVKHGDDLELIVRQGGGAFAFEVIESAVSSWYRRWLRASPLGSIDSLIVSYLPAFQVSAAVGVLRAWVAGGRVEPFEQVGAFTAKLMENAFLEAIRLRESKL
ncbi:MAG TPA: TetR/AcrR family transcriptional regulator [Pseudomonadales bacterium]|nr:TetR/AcrR family transcriptional regulator [Pseudomonadales bacterium]